MQVHGNASSFSPYVGRLLACVCVCALVPLCVYIFLRRTTDPCACVLMHVSVFPGGAPEDRGG